MSVPKCHLYITYYEIATVNLCITLCLCLCHILPPLPSKSVHHQKVQSVEFYICKQIFFFTAKFSSGLRGCVCYKSEWCEGMPVCICEQS